MTAPTPKTPAAAAPKTPAAGAPKTPDVIEFVTEGFGPVALLAVLVIGVAVGVGVYYVLTHVTVEDSRNGG